MPCIIVDVCVFFSFVLVVSITTDATRLYLILKYVHLTSISRELDSATRSRSMCKTCNKSAC